MTDSIAHSSIHAGSLALAKGLALRFDLRPMPFPVAERPSAVLAVAPTSERRHRAAGLPVVILSHRVAATSELDGRLIVCGARDESDAPAAATAAAIADALGLPLVLVHVLSPTPRVMVPGAAAIPGEQGFTVADLDRATARLERLVDAAGIADADLDCRVVRGDTGPTLAALGRSEDAALVVVGATTRTWLSRALDPSVTGHLGRHCDRPVMVCPGDPAPAMRVREALGWRAQRTWRGP